MAKRPFQFNLIALFVFTTVVALGLATWPFVRNVAATVTPPILLMGLVLTGYLLARLMWLRPNK